jgi:hypothetical protein
MSRIRRVIIVLTPIAASSTVYFTSKSFFDSSNNPQLSRPHLSDPSRLKISDYLEIVPIKGKGLGVIALKDIPAYTTIHKEFPAAVAERFPTEIETYSSISEACRQLAPRIRTQFETLHQGTNLGDSQDVRIWNANNFHWADRRLKPGSYGAIFLNLSRINHSCLPNAEYHSDIDSGSMIVVSTQPIRTGEEITICYGPKFHYMTAAERNDYLRSVYDFECDCRACTDPQFVPQSDRIRRQMKENYYCGILNYLDAPDFSAKAMGIESPKSTNTRVLPALKESQGKRRDMFKPGMVQLHRQQSKLYFDSGLKGTFLLQQMFDYSIVALGNAHKEMENQESRLPLMPTPDLQRLMQTLQISVVLMSQLWPKKDLRQEHMKYQLNQQKKIWNIVERQPAIAEAQQLLEEILGREANPWAA